MTLSIGQRLFAAVLLSHAVVGAVALGLARWHLADGAAASPSAIEAQAIEALTTELQARYRDHGGWSFLPSDAAQRRDWLRQALQQPPAGPGAAGAMAMSTTLGQRLGLVDGAGRTLAGLVPGRLLVAAASIDTRARTLAIDGVPIGRLVESRSDNPDDELAVAFLLGHQQQLAIVALVGLGLSVGLAAGLAAHFRTPIRQLATGAQQLEQGHFDARLAVDRDDELGRLAEAFNHLAARLEAAEQARAQWVADTSHELRTPLAVLRAQIEALQDGVRPATAEHLAVMLRQVLALTRLVDDLGALATPEAGGLRYEMQRIGAWPLVEDVAASFSDRARAAGLHLALGPAPARSTVQADPLRLRQVLTNLLENSLRYTTAGGRIEIRASVDADRLRLVVADSAPGVPAALLGRLGERLYRVEASRSRASGGAGLGLALCRRIVEGHGGRLSFAPSPLGGLQVEIALALEP